MFIFRHFLAVSAVWLDLYESFEMPNTITPCYQVSIRHILKPPPRFRVAAVWSLLKDEFCKYSFAFCKPSRICGVEEGSELI